MRARLLLSTLALAALAAFGQATEAGAGAAEELVIIVHPKVAARPTPRELEAIFTRAMRDWPDGGRIIPINLPAGTAPRETFDRVVLGLDPDAATRYWIDRRVRGGAPPPRTVGDPATVVRLVAAVEGAIGYVPARLVTDQVRPVARIAGGKVLR